MSQLRRSQWGPIWAAAIVLVLAWPGDRGSLAVKALRWVADPLHSLPPEPRPIPLGLGDDPDVVERHDAEEAEYYRILSGPLLGRCRLWLRDLEDPFDPSMQRQLLTAMAVLAGLGIWRLQARQPR